jgi:sugar phosphate isomerase/epimerase
MDSPIESFCHLGIVHPMAFPECAGGEGPILETLSRIAEDDFFGAVEITRIKDAAVRREAARLLETSRMDVVFVAQPLLVFAKLDLQAADQAARTKAIDECKRCVDEAYEVGARIMGVASGPDPGESEREAASGRLAKSLQEVCAYAAEQGREYQLAVSLETFDRTADKKRLIGPTREAAAVAREVKTEASNFGLTVDLSHMPLIGETPHEMLIEATDALIHVHLGNCILAQGDSHPRFGVPGGVNDVEEVRQFLEVLVYTGFFRKSVPTSMPVVSFEVKPAEGETSAAIIANAKRTFKDAWAKL